VKTSIPLTIILPLETRRSPWDFPLVSFNVAFWEGAAKERFMLMGFPLLTVKDSGPNKTDPPAQEDSANTSIKNGTEMMVKNFLI